MTKHPIALRLGRQECKNYLLLHSAFTFTLECSVFPKQSSDVCAKNEANKKEYVLNSTWGKCSRCGECALRDASIRVTFPGRVGCVACLMFCLLVKNKMNLCTSYIKQIMNVLVRAMEQIFALLNGTFHLSPHENICKIALINIHYLYAIVLIIL